MLDVSSPDVNHTGSFFLWINVRVNESMRFHHQSQSDRVHSLSSTVRIPCWICNHQFPYQHYSLNWSLNFPECSRTYQWQELINMYKWSDERVIIKWSNSETRRDYSVRGPQISAILLLILFLVKVSFYISSLLFAAFSFLGYAQYPNIQDFLYFAQFITYISSSFFQGLSAKKSHA